MKWWGNWTQVFCEVIWVKVYWIHHSTFYEEVSFKKKEEIQEEIKRKKYRDTLPDKKKESDWKGSYDFNILKRTQNIHKSSQTWTDT